MNILILRCQRRFSNFGPFEFGFGKQRHIITLKRILNKNCLYPPSPCINHTLLYYMMLLDTVHICKQLTEHKSQTRHRQTCCFMWEYCQVKNTLRQSEANEDHQLSSIGDLICVIVFYRICTETCMVPDGTWVTSTDVQIIIIGIL